MSSTATRPKHLTGSERTAALAAIGTAQREHEHVAIRPKRAGGEDQRAEAVEIPRGPRVGKELDKALESAAATWPDDDLWEIIGADDYADSPDTDPEGEETDMFDAPVVFGEFSTVSNPETPGWMG